jgi:hypothetical protein
LENNSFGSPDNAFEGFEETYRGRQLLGMVWTQPRYVIRYLLRVEPDKYVLPLLVLMGVNNVVEKAAEDHTGDSVGIAGIILFALVGGPLAGIFSGYVCSGLLGFTGRWLGGEAEGYQLRTVQAWASVPTICMLLLLPVELLFFGGELFSASQPTMQASEELVVEFALAKGVLAVWSLVLFVGGLAEAQQFSVGKALLNILLAVGIIVVPLGLLLLLFVSPR